MIRSQNVITSTTWANKPSAYITGQPIFITNAGTKGSHWFYDGTRWKPMNGACVLATWDSASSSIANSETMIYQVQLPANLWQTGDRLRFYVGQTKSGTTDTANVNVRIGTTGTNGDTLVVNKTILNSAALRQAGGVFDIRLESATSALVLPSSRATLGYGGSSSVAFDAATTISSASANALYVSVLILSAGAADTTQLIDSQIHFISKAN